MMTDKVKPTDLLEMKWINIHGLTWPVCVNSFLSWLFSSHSICLLYQNRFHLIDNKLITLHAIYRHIKSNNNETNNNVKQKATNIELIPRSQKSIDIFRLIKRRKWKLNDCN